MRKMISLSVLRPTRGLEFAQSAHSIEIALLDACSLGLIDHKSALRPKFRTWTMKIPDSFNHLVRLFLSIDCEYAWFVEEDVVVPHNALEQMLAMDADVTTVSYNLKGEIPNRLSEIRTDDGELHTLATGCMLIHRRVFLALKDPWFRTDMSPGMRHPGSSTPKPFLDLIEHSFDYGGHDGFFTLTAIRAGFDVRPVPDLRCEHLLLNAMGRVGVNDGCHDISRVV